MKRSILFFLLAGALLAPPVVFGQEIVQTARGPAKVSYLPQFLAGGGYQTVLTIRNLSAERQQVGADFYAPDGQRGLLLGDIGGLQNGFVVNLAESATFKKTLSFPDGTLKTGWVGFSQPFNPISGQLLTSISITYQKVGDDSFIADIGDLAPVDVTNRVAFYWGNNLGLAVANPSETMATIVSLVRKGSGETVTLALPPQNQFARVVSDLFPGLGPEDLIELVSPAPVAVLLLASTEGGKFQAVAVATAKQ